MSNNYQSFTGWENGTAETSNGSAGTRTVQSTKKKNGTYALRCNPTTTAIGHMIFFALGSTGQMPAQAPSGTVYVKVDFLYDTKASSNNEDILHVRYYGGSDKISVRLNSSGNLEVYDQGLSLIATGTTVLSSNTWYRIELKSVQGTSAAYELRIDGVTELSGTCNQANLDPSYVVTGKFVNRNGNTVDYYYDDLIVAYNDWVGAAQVITKNVSGNGSVQEWTAGTNASNYLEVDEVVADGTSTYVQAPSVANKTSTFVFPSHDFTGKTIKSIKTQIYIYTPTGTSNTKSRLISGGTTSDLTIGAVGAGLIYVTRYIDQDPNTTLDWTAAAVNAIEVGVNEANAVNTRCSQVTYSAVIIDSPSTGANNALMMMGVG